MSPILDNVISANYLLSSLLFMYALKSLGHPESAKRGNISGILGMVVAVTTTLAMPKLFFYNFLTFIIFSLAAFVGIDFVKNAEMISMPQLVAGFHAMVGLSALLVGLSRFFDESAKMTGSETVECLIGIFFGGVTLSGSVVAAGKLQGSIEAKPLALPFKNVINALLGALCLFGSFRVCVSHQNFVSFFLVVFLSLVLGFHLVMSIGGADMPVVVSMLNSYSGWTTTAAGFMLNNYVMIVAGSIIGSSGAILSYVMCKNMNRSFVSVILGGFGAEEGKMVTAEGNFTETNVKEVADELLKAKKVIIIPGYGMAVARCQQAIAGIAEVLRKKGIVVKFAIHPVAGRLPGHMNVLLAEANVPYDLVYELEKVNSEFETCSVALVCGANDIVNPLACEDLSSPIGGMPVLECWKSRLCVVMKRSMATGYSGVDNPLFYKENTRMLFGNAKEKADELLEVLKTLSNLKPSEEGIKANLLNFNAKSAAEEIVKVFPPATKSIGVLNEGLMDPSETRVSLTPNIISKLRDMKYNVFVETKSGQKASFPDGAFANEGCVLCKNKEEVVKNSDVIVKVGTLTEKELPIYKPNLVIIANLKPLYNRPLLEVVAKANLTTLAMDAIPRISRAQKMDVLSSMANMAGYKAVVEAFHYLPRFSKQLTTAAGQVNPARVFIVGAGVAGLSAIGTARSLGAIVKANDTRSAVKEQVESMGAEFVPVPFKEEGEGQGGYSKQMSEAFTKAQLELYAKLCKESDVVITTAQIPGVKAPLLITKEMVRSMRPGSVCVDLAAGQGGNIELTKKDEVYTDEVSGVTIIGLSNLAYTMPAQASELYASNIAHLLKHMKDADHLDEFLFEKDDEIVRPILCTRKGAFVYEPVKVMNTKTAQPQPSAPKPQDEAKQSLLAVEEVQEILTEKAPSETTTPWLGFLASFLVLPFVFIILGIEADLKLLNNFMTFFMSVIIGYFIVWSVDPALHTPLMSVTNAISGIIVLGALVQIPSKSAVSSVLGVIGTFSASVNIFAGFFITDRMLKMFRK